MNEQIHGNRIPAELEIQFVSDIRKFLQNWFDREKPEFRPTEINEELVASFATFTAHKLFLGLADSPTELDWYGWLDLVTGAVAAFDGQPSSSGLPGLLHSDGFLWELAECTAHSLSAKGMPLKSPHWGGDPRSSAFAARKTAQPERLTEMAEDILNGTVYDDGTLTEELMLNPNLPVEAAIKLARQWRGVNEFGYQLCSRSDATPEALDEWSDDWDIMVADKIAKHPNTRLETLQKMARSDTPSLVREAVASKRLSEEFIIDLAKSPNPATRAVVAEWGSNPALLEKLAADENDGVRLVAVQNKHTPENVVHRVAQTDRNISVVAAAARVVTDTKLLDSVLERWWESGVPEEIGRAILKNPHASEVAKTVAVLASPNIGARP